MSLVPIDEVVQIPDVTTHDPATGAVIDADSAPTFDVFEEGTDTPILDDQTMTKRTSLTGNYRGSFTASAANGFEAGKWYNVVAAATVDAIAAKKMLMHFRVAPAESSAGVPKVDTSHVAGTAQTARDLGASVLLSSGTGTGQVKLAAGYVAPNWGDVGNPTTTVGLSGTTVKTATDIASQITALLGAVADAAATGDPGSTAVIPLVKQLVNILIGSDGVATFPSAAAPGNAVSLAEVLRSIYTQLGVAGAGLSAMPWNATWDAEVQSEVQDALEANHLDHLLANAYDPASKPGAADALLNEIIGDDSGVSRFTANALELAPTGGSAPTADEIANQVWDEARADHTTAGSFGQGAASVQGNVTGSVGSVSGAVGSVTGAVGSVTGAVGSVTGNVGGTVASVVGAVGSVAGAVGSVTGNVGGSVGSVATGGIAAASFAANAIDAAALAADAIAEIQNGLATLAVIGALADTAADGDPTSSDTVMAYVKQLVNTLVGSAGIPTYPSAAAPGNGVSLAEALRQTYDKVSGLTFTKANEVDANVQSLNGVTLTGSGTLGDEWDS